MKYENTDDSFITIKSAQKANGKKLLPNGEINFKSKYEYLLPKINVLSQRQLIGIALDDKSWQIRKLALQKIRNRNIVSEIAFNDESPHIRKHFLRIFNQSAIRQIALKDPSANVRKSAIAYITDIDLLKHIALNDSSRIVRSKATKKIKNEEFLKKVIKSDISTSTKNKLIKKIDDEDLLFEIIKSYVSGINPLNIIKKISNPEYLFDLYLESKIDLKHAIIEQINDEDLLLNAFYLETHEPLNKAIFDKITEEKSFEHVFLNASNDEFKIKSIKNIHNQNLLLDVIYGDYDFQTKEYAIFNLNQKNLVDIYNDESLEGKLRLEALSHVEDETGLIEICENTQSISVILTALPNINNLEFIKSFGLTHESWKVKSLAIAKVDDENLLFDIALKEPCWFSRKLAVEGIIRIPRNHSNTESRDEKLLKILSKEDNNKIQKMIVNSIRSPEILFEAFKLGHVDYLDEDRIVKFQDAEDVLEYIVLNHNGTSQRKKAIEYISDEETLKWFALNVDSEELRDLALIENDEKYKESERKWSFNPTLRFLDEDVFYEYLMKCKKGLYNYSGCIVEKLMENIQNTSYLKDLFLNGENEYVFKYAGESDNLDITCIDDDEIIKRIIFFDECADDYPEGIFGKIHDEEKLLNYILNYKGESSWILTEAVEYITSDECLFKIVNCGNLELALKTIAVSSITNPEMLEEIVLNHPNVYVRNQAIKNIKNKDLIKHLALNDSSQIIRKSALMWCEYEKDYWGYVPAGDTKTMVSDENMLEDILLKSNDGRIRSIAFNLINDETRISRIARTSRDVEIRNRAAQSIKNQDVLIEIALNDPSRIVRTSAIDSIDEDNLIKIVNDLKDWYIRDCALKQITDESTIKDFAFNDSNWHVRHTAVSKIHDMDALKEIALADSNINIRRLAIEKIGSINILNEILSRTTHYTTPNIVKGKLEVLR